MSLAEDYETHVLNEIIAVLLRSAAGYRNAAGLVENEWSVAYRTRAATRDESAGFLQRCVLALNGKPAAAGSIVGAAYATFFGASQNAGRTTISAQTLTRNDLLMMERLSCALVDRRLSSPVLDAIRVVGEKIGLPMAMEAVNSKPLVFAAAM